jgi:hypothetical protein
MSFTTIATRGFQTNLPNVMQGPSTFYKWMPHKQFEYKKMHFKKWSMFGPTYYVIILFC